jgi:prolycopene isomerase
VTGFHTEGCEVVVVGGGLAGLTAGALLARAGEKVLVVEAEDTPGGYARSVAIDGYRFEPAIHLVMGGDAAGRPGRGLIHEVLGLLGVADRCEFLALDPFYGVRLPGLTVEVPAGRDGYLDAHLEHFPSAARGLTELVDVWSGVYQELLAWPIRPRLVDWPSAPLRWPRLVRSSRATTEKVSNRYLENPQLRTLHCAPSPAYMGLPPSEASFVVWAVMMSSYVEEGAYYCRGGFQRLADAFTEGLARHGGELLAGHRVQRIDVDQGRIEGVILDDGRRIAARRVVSTIDVRETFGILIDPRHLPGRWMRRIRNDGLSISVFGLYLGTNLDVTAVGVPMETFVFPSWDLEAGFRTGSSGVEDVTVTIPTVADPQLAPPGCHQVIVMGNAPASDGAIDEEQVAAGYVRLAEQVIPDLANHIVYALGAEHGPAGPLSLPLHEIGPIYGWDNTPGNSGLSRLPQTTPVDGLYLAGQWTQPGHGVWTVVASGVQVARLLLGASTSKGLSPLRL